ncbi:hypothetical protein K501DRAFT_293132 [Backusella circina FSU 941]|nr:hypothetical protein K501DRAFT_293132 [Backusella circina FSU 941]
MYSNQGGSSNQYLSSRGIQFSFLKPNEQQNYEKLFFERGAAMDGNKLSASKVSELLKLSNVDNDSLAKIWDLASIAQTPYLTLPEFILAMFLINIKLNGKPIPASIPSNIREEIEVAMATIASTETQPQQQRPQQQQQQLANAAIPQQYTSNFNNNNNNMNNIRSMMMPQPQAPMATGAMRPLQPMMTGAVRPVQPGYTTNFQMPLSTGYQAQKPRLQNLDFAKKMMPDQGGNINLLIPSLGNEKMSWKISPEDKQRYREIFKAWDVSESGYISGDVAKDVFTQSQLPPQDLQKIWDMADIEKRGSLDEDEFAIAMHLVFRKLNGAEVPSVLPPELKPPTSVLKKFILGRRPPVSAPSFGSPHERKKESYESESDDDDGGYVSTSRRRGPSSYSSRRYGSDDEVDVALLEDLRRQISEEKRHLSKTEAQVPRDYAGGSSSSIYSLEELKEKIKRVNQDLKNAVRANPNSSKYFENANTLVDLIESQKSLQDEIQYLCNRDIPVLARQLRSSAAELRDSKIRHTRKNDGSQDFMAFIQPTGPGGTVTESDRVRAKAKAMLAARKAGSGGASTDANFGFRRAEEEKQEADKKADVAERDMEKSRTALVDMRGDLRYLEDLSHSKQVEDKMRFDNGQDLPYELKRFIEQLEYESNAASTAPYSSPNASSGISSSPSAGYQSPSLSASTSSPRPKTTPARPRTAEEIKKEAERRVQERLAALQAKRNPGASPKPVASSKPPMSKPDEAEVVAQQRLRDAERRAQDMLQSPATQHKETEFKVNEESERDLQRQREQEERQRQEEQDNEAKRLQAEREDEEKRRIEEEKDMEERRRQVFAKEEAERQARFDALKREEEESEERAAAKQSKEHKPEEASVDQAFTTSPPPLAPPASEPVVSPSTSSNNPFAKLQQANQSEEVSRSIPGSSQAEKPNEATNKRVSYNPFAAFSAFSATKAGAKDDSDSEDEGWDTKQGDSDDDEADFPAAGNAKNLAGKLFSAMSKPQGTSLKKTVTNDRSAASVSGHVVGGGDSSVTPPSFTVSNTSNLPEISAPAPVAAPLSGGDFLSELQSRTSGTSPVTNNSPLPEHGKQPQPAATEELGPEKGIG